MNPTLGTSAAPGSGSIPTAAATAPVPELLEHLFRHESGKMVAILTGIFGIENLALAEDVVQEALMRALQTWPFYGIPANPAAWLMRTSRNLALDVVRRQKNFRDKQPEIVRQMESASAFPEADALDHDRITDDRLRLMFVCCHPVLPLEAQVAMALKLLCGFNVTEVSHAFLTTEAAIAKRLTRARQKLAEARVRFEIPESGELSARLDGVWQALYLLFNEGYKASSGEKLVREDVAREAIRLTKLLAQHPAGNRPATHALLALMLLNFARTPARQDEQGNLLRLQDQDRSRWDKGLIGEGLHHLAQSAAGSEISRYHLQAAISACHCMAQDYASTDWPRILSLYDRLIEFDASPVVALNRAVAVANVHGPDAGFAAISALQGAAELRSYYLLYAVMGDFEVRRENWPLAADHFHQALGLTGVASEQRYLAERMRFCRQAALAAVA